MQKNVYDFYKGAGSYNATSVAHDYKQPELKPVQHTHADKNAQITKAVAIRVLSYFAIVFIALCGIFVSSLVHRVQTEQLERNIQKLHRLENEEVFFQAELSRKTEPETIRALAMEQLGMHYITEEPIYIRVKQGEEILIHK